MNNAIQVVVSLSGGMDSSVCAALAVRDYGADGVAALHISYGQRTEAREQAAFQGICDRLQIRRRLIVRTPFFRAIGGSALTDSDIAVPNAGPEIGSEDSGDLCAVPQCTFFVGSGQLGRGTGRRTHLYRRRTAGQFGLSRLPSGVLRAFNEVIRTGTKEGRIQIETPLIALRKARDCDAWP